MAKEFELLKFPLDPKSFYEIYKKKKFFKFDHLNYKKIFTKFKNIHDKIYQILDKKIIKLNEVNRYIIYSDIHIINYLLHHIYYQLLQKNFKKEKIEIIYETGGDVSNILNINEEVNSKNKTLENQNSQLSMNLTIENIIDSIKGDTPEERERYLARKLANYEINNN